MFLRLAATATATAVFSSAPCGDDEPAHAAGLPVLAFTDKVER